MGQEVPLEKEMASTPVFLLENPMDRETLQATVHGVTRVGQALFLNTRHKNNW